MSEEMKRSSTAERRAFSSIAEELKKMAEQPMARTGSTVA
jgi:hypothetical protein